MNKMISFLIPLLLVFWSLPHHLLAVQADDTLSFTILTVDATGESCFRQSELDFNPWVSGLAMASFEEPAVSIRFFRAGPDWEMDELHYAPKRQYLLVLQGTLEIRTSTGDTRLFTEGDVLLVEDTYGKGHRTRNAGGSELLLAWVGL